MTGPAPLDLIQRMGPDFDYSVLDRIPDEFLKTQPPEVQGAVKRLRQFGLTLQQVRNPAPADRIGEGAFPAPPQQGLPPQGRVSLDEPIQAVLNLLQIPKILRATMDSKQKGTPFMQELAHQERITQQLAQEFWHQATVGAVPSPKVAPEQEASFNAITKPIAAIGAMGLQGMGVVKALGWVSKVPVAANVLEQLPLRLRDVGAGAISFGVIDALRAEGVPEDPSALDPSGVLAAKLTNMGVPDRLALGLSGATVGGVLSGTLLGIGRGLEMGRTLKVAKSATPEQIEGIKEGLRRLGYVPENQTNYQLVNQYFKAVKKIVHDESMAGAVADQLSREEWIAQSVFGDAKIAQESEEARYITGLMRGNPGSISLATSISDPTVVQQAAKKLGLSVELRAIDKVPGVSYDLLISRPNYEYPAFEVATRQTKKSTKVIKDFARSMSRDLFAKKSEDIFLLADGSLVRGGFTTKELAEKIRPQVPVVAGVERPDLGIKQVSQMINLALKDQNTLMVDLPSKITQEQFRALGPAINVRRFDKVILQQGLKTVELPSPLGQQVQDAVATMVKPSKTSTRLTEELVNQYKRSGVFNGQAAVLADGTPVAIQKKAGLFYVVKDPLTGQDIRVHPKRITALPASLEGEQAPSGLFYQFLSPDEQQAFAKLRVGILGDLTKPIEKFRDLMQFANSRGFIASQMKGGKIELQRMTDGETLTFWDLNAATEAVRKSVGPMPDLTPGDVKKVLGDIGFIIPQGSPIKPNEGFPMPIALMEQMMHLEGNRGPDWLKLHLVPSRGLFLDMDKKYGTAWFPLFDNIQSRMVQRSNFEAAWFMNKAPGLSPGTKPLKEIMKMAEGGNPEKITTWLELDEPGRLAFERTMMPGEVAAAKDLRKWYNELFTQFGIEADFVENYAPHVREWVEKHGGNPNQFLNDPLKPTKAGQFWADNYRLGYLDVYDTDAFRVAMRYLKEGASNRFMKEPMEQAAAMVKQMAATNKQLAYPMGYFLQAVRGTEFAEQRVALSETFQTLIESLPGAVPTRSISDFADRASAFYLGMVYTGTMGARPGLAVRNIMNAWMMSWPIYGGNKGKFMEAMSMAMTRPGMDEAINDGAISIFRATRPMADEIASRMPEAINRMTEAGFYMYDSADMYNRAATYWAARLKAQDALTKFAKLAPKTTPERLVELKQSLVRESGMAIQEPQIVEEFIRRASISPEQAAKFAGKQASDVINFLYGRGMQPRWMRGVGGRLVGQFGTWPLWYIDYVRRVSINLAKNGSKTDAAVFLARHALLNAAIGYTGRKVFDVDLGRWMTYPAVFYSGGPGFQIAMGLATLARGLGPMATMSDDPYAKSHVTEGIQMIENTLPSMIPFRYAVKDVVRLAESTDPAERVAALLSTRTTKDYQLNRSLQTLLDQVVEPFSTSSDALNQMANSAAAGQPAAISPEQMGLQTPSAQQGTGPTPQAPPMVPPAQPAFAPLPQVQVPHTSYRERNEVTRPAESRPIPEF